MRENTIGQVSEEQLLVHVESLNERKDASQEAFDALVQKLLGKAPNCKANTHSLRRPTDYNDEYPTEKEASFKLGSSEVTVGYRVDLGTPPTSRVWIDTPIVVDNLAQGLMDSIYPPQPYEYVEIESSPYYGSLDVRVGAKTRPGDFGRDIFLKEYTGGGLFPSIQTEGEGMLNAVDNLVALLTDAKPQNVEYKKPFEHARI